MILRAWAGWSELAHFAHVRRYLFAWRESYANTTAKLICRPLNLILIFPVRWYILTNTRAFLYFPSFCPAQADSLVSLYGQCQTKKRLKPCTKMHIFRFIKRTCTKYHNCICSPLIYSIVSNDFFFFFFFFFFLWDSEILDQTARMSKLIWAFTL